MLKHYKIGEPPEWQRKIVLLMMALLGATMLLFTAWAVIMFTVESGPEACEAAGGTYDYNWDECVQESDGG